MLKMIYLDKEGRDRFVAKGTIAPTLACFLAGMLLGSLVTFLVKFI
jgi:hypothetical protein